MVSVEFSLIEETLVVPEEVQQALRTVEALVREKSNTFVALEWVGVQKGKMEVVVRNMVVAEALVKQLSNTLASVAYCGRHPWYCALTIQQHCR